MIPCVDHVRCAKVLAGLRLRKSHVRLYHAGFAYEGAFHHSNANIWGKKFDLFHVRWAFSYAPALRVAYESIAWNTMSVNNSRFIFMKVATVFMNKESERGRTNSFLSPQYIAVVVDTRYVHSYISKRTSMHEVLRYYGADRARKNHISFHSTALDLRQNYRVKQWVRESKRKLHVINSPRVLQVRKGVIDHATLLFPILSVIGICV